jgi:hypothetical protein
VFPGRRTSQLRAKRPKKFLSGWFESRGNMATVKFIEYAEASAELRAIYDGIMPTRKIDWINNF